MKKIVCLLGLFVMSVHAGIQPALTILNPRAGSVAPSSVSAMPQPVNVQRSVIVTAGSLRDNVSRIAKQFGWTTVVWKVSSDYRWVGTTKLFGQDVNAIFNALLAGYPLQANFYLGNHVLVIVPRNVNRNAV